MFSNWKKVTFILLFIFLLPLKPVGAASTCPTDDPCKDEVSAFDKIRCYSDIVNICSSQRESMTAQVVYLTTKIVLTSAKIDQAKDKIKTLEEEIENLTEKIDKLETTLTSITSVFLDRIVATYKYGDVSYFNVIIGSARISDLVNRFKYIQTVQSHDRKLLFQLQNSKENFQDQKDLREDKKLELDSTKKQLEKEELALAVQKKEKELFLETTRNSEVRYKQELEAARKEAEGIQKAASILSAAGVAKRVNRGDTIGLMGNTGFSTGAHLHFSVYNLNESDLDKFNFNSGYQNPFDVLVSKSVPFEANSCDDVSPSQKSSKSVGNGSWDWPMSNPTISQCYGHTPWSWRYQSGIHNGVDMYDDDNVLVKAVESGNAYTYRGGQSAGNGVFIFHDNGKMTLFWHLQ